jgi:hypothetical protein
MANSIKEAMDEILRIRNATEEDANDRNRLQTERTVDSAQVAAYDFALSEICEGLVGARKGARHCCGYDISCEECLEERCSIRHILPTDEEVKRATPKD